MNEREQRQAVAEGVLDRMRKKEWHQLDLLIAQTGDVQFWADILRYELDIGSLSTGILQEDAALKRLAEFGVQSMSPFHYAGFQGSDRMIRKGLQFRLNVDVSLGDGLTALHLASFAGRLETVVQLVDEFKANVNAIDRRRWSPLHYACAMGHAEVVEFLLRRRADAGARDVEGATAAFRAREQSHERIVSCLLEFYGDGDILLVEEVDGRKTCSPVYAVPCRKDLRESGANENLVGEVGSEERSDGGPVDGAVNGVDCDTGTDSVVDEINRPEVDQIQRKSRMQLDPDKRKGLKIHPPPQSDSRHSEDEKATEHSSQKNKPEMKFSEASIPGCPPRYHKKPHLYEEICLPEEEKSSLPELDEEINSFEQPTEIQKTSIQDNSFGYQKVTSHYEELPEENGSQLESVDDVGTDLQWHPSKTSHNKSKKAGFAELDYTRGHRKVTRRPTYEEINLPEDNDKRQKIDEEDKTIRQTAGILDTETKSQESKDASWTPNETVKNEGTIDFLRFGYQRKPHHYEEIELPVCLDVESQTEPLVDSDLELRVRSLLRAELGKLIPSICNRLSSANKDRPETKSTLDFVSEFLRTENSGGDDRKIADDAEDFMTFRQLQRLVREEIQVFAGNAYLVNVSKEFSDECLESLKILERTSSDSNSANFSQKEDRSSSETEEKRILPDDIDSKRGHDNKEMDTDSVSIEGVHYTEGPRPSTDHRPQEKTLTSVLCPPGFFRRGFFDRKKEKPSNCQTQTDGSTPLMKPEDDQQQESTNGENPEQNQKQTGTNPNSMGQSQFYVRLDDDL